MKLNWMAPHRSSLVTASAIAVLVMMLGYACDRYSLRHDMWLGLDDAVLGILIGAIVLVHEERRVREMRRRLHVIRDMNCFVRNELQIIDIVAATEEDNDRMGALQQCVDHIEWALRELLPGNVVLEESKPVFDPARYQVKRSA
jgi:hypothetical protein